MKTFLRPSEVQTFTAPSGGVMVDVPLLIGSLLVVPTVAAAEGDPFEAVLAGVLQLPRNDSEAWDEGDKVYWDDGAAVVTTDDASAANPLIGVAVEVIAASPAQATGLVRLDGVAR